MLAAVRAADPRQRGARVGHDLHRPVRRGRVRRELRPYGLRLGILRGGDGVAARARAGASSTARSTIRTSMLRGSKLRRILRELYAGSLQRLGCAAADRRALGAGCASLGARRRTRSKRRYPTTISLARRARLATGADLSRMLPWEPRASGRRSSPARALSPTPKAARSTCSTRSIASQGEGREAGGFGEGALVPRQRLALARARPGDRRRRAANGCSRAGTPGGSR